MNLADQSTEQLTVIDAEYSVETGHKIAQPVVHLFCRDADRNYRQIDVEGFRPYFMMDYDEFVERTSDVINDRHVLAVEADFTRVEWDDDGNLTRGANENPDDVAQTLMTVANDTAIYHKPDTFDALDGRKLVKVYTVEPAHVGKIRDHWEQTWEADIPFTRRFLISSGIHNGVAVPTGAERVRYENWHGHSDSDTRVQEIRPCEPPDVQPRMLVVDIEVRTNGGGVPDPADANNEITAITSYDNYTDEYAGWILESEQWERDYDDAEFADDVSAELDIDLDVMNVFDHETQMVEDFHEWVLDRNFDMMSGWNSSGFDAPYIIQRSYNISAYSIRDWDFQDSPFNAGDEWPEPVIEGMVLFDMLDAYKKTQYRDLRSYKLEDVAQAELGMGKVQLEESLDDAWHKQPVEFMRYNVRDVQAVVEIEESSGLLDLYDNMRQVTGALYNTCNHNGPMLDTLFLRQAYDEGIALTTNEPVPPEEGKYHGAKVFDVTPGYVKNAVYPDLSSLYPNLFAMLNLGSETIVGDDDELSASEYTHEDVYRVPIDNREFKKIPKGESYSNIDRDKYKGVITPEGGVREMFDPIYEDMYVLKPEIKESFLTSTIDDLIELKNEYTGDAYKAVKRVTNSCLTPDTNVLTPSGIVSITDVSVGDDVYSWNPETGEIEIKSVTETIEKPDYTDELVHIQNEMLDLKVTPDHRLYTKRTRHTDGWEITEAGDLNEWTHYETPNEWFFDHGSGIETVDIADHLDDDYIITDTTVSAGKTHNTFPRYYDGDDFIELIGWFITEGYSEVYDDEPRGDIVNLSQYKDINEDHYNSISDLLDRMDIRHGKRETHFTICGSTFRDLLSELCGCCSAEKRIPDMVFEHASRDQKQRLLRVLMKGDGDARESPKRYSTKSATLRDDFIRLCWELGHKPTYSYDDGGENNTGVWRIHWTSDEDSNSNMSFRMHRDASQEVADDGVYCIQVEDNHTLVAGRNGKFSVIMNCYGVAGDSASGGKGFRLFDRRVAEGITLAGRRTIEHTADEFTKYIQENFDEDARLVAGDTDSCVSSIPSADNFRNVKNWSEEACGYVDRSYDEFVQDEFEMRDDYDTHRLHVELESVASGLFYIEDFDDDSPERVGVKKRYAQHIIWDDDDGWLDLPDSDETDYDVLGDPDNESQLADLKSVSLQDYDSGVLSQYDPHDHIGIKGFEYVRSDSATVTKEAQLNVLTNILLVDNPEDRIHEYLSDLVDEIHSDDFDVSKLGRPKGISNPLDDYGWKSIEELENDSNYTVKPEDEEHGGRYVSTPSPAYRGAKYADDHIPWEDISAGSKPVRFYVETVRGDTFPAAYRYDTYPQDKQRPDPLEVKRDVDAIAVEDPSRIPREFVLDTEKMIDKELKQKIQPILRTIDADWNGLVGRGRQTGLDQWG